MIIDKLELELYTIGTVGQVEYEVYIEGRGLWIILDSGATGNFIDLRTVI